MHATLMSRTWGREITTTVVNGYPCRVYQDRPRSVAALLQDASRWCGRTFAVEGGRRLSFDDFAHAVGRVASHLEARGVRRGDRVILLAYNSLEWLAAFWALQSLGAVTVLANAWWSPAEIAEGLADVSPAAVVADQLAKRGLQGRADAIDLQELRAVVDATDVPEPRTLPLVDEDEVAIIMFSSGTSGRAKGVLMSHRGVVANIQNLLALTGRMPHELPPDSQGTVSLLTVPLFHLAGIQTSFSTLLSGGTLVLLQGRFDPGAVLRLIESERVRVWGSIPTMVSRVLEYPELDQYDTSSLRSIPMGGAAISPELRQKVQRAFPGVKKSVGSLFGSTEAGGVLAAGSADDLQGRSGCVGKPLPVVELRIRHPDANGVGEILARTPTATLGCWGDPSPTTDVDGWVATGDLGRIEDGYLILSGRSKDIVIRAGENVACAHVEQCLQRHPAVVEVAVLPLPHADLGEEVAAVVVLRAGAAVTEQELEAHASASLGRFQVPSSWWLRAEPLPTNASGKIAKRELLALWTARERTS
ncbi:class I adenylate-forming enzyme family protein [Variovorax sp. J22P271]|uniref:class I adenylate-forming enzyme family protein n=1 Tax=Variovorax davisae TaxID=3053515 RepID=UPI0025749215|nr:class I adenylate-forming enzyme family protein [Variovorax sp. J22P271]MDM0032425.1 class I adenylate-forming enzyme family protein [Variovorax sp. J22P271]